jgi:hypothetical protein
MKTTSIALNAAVVLIICLQIQFVSAQSLGIQMIQNAGKPCSQTFFNATGLAIFNYVNATTTQVLKGLNYTTQTFPVNPVQIVNIVSARRGLLRGDKGNSEGDYNNKGPNELQSDNGLQGSAHVPQSIDRGLTTVSVACTVRI